LIEVDFERISTQAAYNLQIGSIVPRPVAWVSTVNGSGLPNLAPFSYFNGICSNPPALLFCPVNHPDGREKDTLRNIREIGDFVVNIATESLVFAVNHTAAEYPSEISEFAAAGLTALPGVVVKAPRVAESPIQLECRLIQIVAVGTGGNSGHVVIGRIVYGHFHPTVYQDGRVLLDMLKPIARFAGTTYGPVRDTFDLPRPAIEPSAVDGATACDKTHGNATKTSQ
jgi:flavin reductase (DIM6/NTAB) family NADH-FMN oxidoreductase RutF